MVEPLVSEDSTNEIKKSCRFFVIFDGTMAEVTAL